jgi:hypothetical protein
MHDGGTTPAGGGRIVAAVGIAYPLAVSTCGAKRISIEQHGHKMVGIG